MSHRGLWRAALNRLPAGVGAVMALILLAAPCCAIQIALPPVGTPVNYDFVAKEPRFIIAHDQPAGDVLVNQVRFEQGRRLRADGPFLGVHLVLRGAGIVQLIDEQAISFDEILSIEGDGDSVLAVGSNTSISASYQGIDDEYIYGWSFEFAQPTLFRGISWNISPDLAPGVQLPATLGIEMFVWGEGLIVVPEPAGGATMIIGLAVLGLRRPTICMKTPQHGCK